MWHSSCELKQEDLPAFRDQQQTLISFFRRCPQFSHLSLEVDCASCMDDPLPIRSDPSVCLFPHIRHGFCGHLDGGGRLSRGRHHWARGCCERFALTTPSCPMMPT